MASTPAPVVEACCREEYSAPIVSGPSEPDLPHNNDSVFQSLTVHPTDPDTVVLSTQRNGYWVIRMAPDAPTQLVTFGLGYNDLNANMCLMHGTNTGQEWKLVGPEMRHRHIANLDISANERDIFSGWISKDGGRT